MLPQPARGVSQDDDVPLAGACFGLDDRVMQRLSPLPRLHDSRSTRRDIQFQAGRACAADLLARLGSVDTRVGIAANRAPIWPAGFVGSITHSDRWLGVAVARDMDLRGLGIDLEALATGDAVDAIEAVCLNPQEILMRSPLPIERSLFCTICFSAKEALYKCLAPIVGRYFDFHDAEIDCLDPAGGGVRLRLLCDLSAEFGAGTRLTGRWRHHDGHVLTAFALTAAGRAP